jgi:hypothetical protein
MEFFDKWHPVLRWILFVPIFFVVYFVLNLIIASNIARYFGPPEESIASYILHTIQRDGISVAIGIYVSCMCAPRHRIVIASIYAGLLLFLLGIGLMEVVYTSEPKDIWLFVITCGVSIIACIIGLISVIHKEKERKQQTISV